MLLPPGTASPQGCPSSQCLAAHTQIDYVQCTYQQAKGKVVWEQFVCWYCRWHVMHVCITTLSTCTTHQIQHQLYQFINDTDKEANNMHV